MFPELPPDLPDECLEPIGPVQLGQHVVQPFQCWLASCDCTVHRNHLNQLPGVNLISGSTDVLNIYIGYG